MKILLLEILTFTTVAFMAFPLARTSKNDENTLARLENVGTFGM